VRFLLFSSGTKGLLETGIKSEQNKKQGANKISTHQSDHRASLQAMHSPLWWSFGTEKSVYRMSYYSVQILDTEDTKPQWVNHMIAPIK
jgi:hypothetical protein